MLGVATFVVTMVGAVVVTDHVTGKLHIDDGMSAIAMPVTAR